MHATINVHIHDTPPELAAKIGEVFGVKLQAAYDGDGTPRTEWYSVPIGDTTITFFSHKRPAATEPAAGG